MPGRGGAPKEPAARRRRNVPVRGEWQSTPGIGWQHGPLPAPPDGLLEVSRKAWSTWFQAWFASHWTPVDLPGLETVITLFDATRRGELQRSAELRMLMDNYGITPKGQQDRRWAPPKAEETPKQEEQANAGPYAHLRAV
jgi:hypothetical protein